MCSGVGGIVAAFAEVADLASLEIAAWISARPSPAPAPNEHVHARAAQDGGGCSTEGRPRPRTGSIMKHIIKRGRRSGRPRRAPPTGRAARASPRRRGLLRQAFFAV
jgi:hypothetical protein